MLRSVDRFLVHRFKQRISLGVLRQFVVIKDHVQFDGIGLECGVDDDIFLDQRVNEALTVVVGFIELPDLVPSQP